MNFIQEQHKLMWLFYAPTLQKEAICFLSRQSTASKVKQEGNTHLKSNKVVGLLLLSS